MSGLVNFDIGGLAKGLMDGLDDLFTSDEERLKYADMIEARLHDRLKDQVAINVEEAKHPSLFVSGWRPFIGWVCGVGIGFQFVMRPVMIWVMDVSAMLAGSPPITHPPSLDVEQLMSLVVAMLGIAGYRSYEKTKKVARVK